MIKQYVIQMAQLPKEILVTEKTSPNTVEVGGTYISSVVELWIVTIGGDDIFHTRCETANDAAAVVRDYILDHLE